MRFKMTIACCVGLFLLLTVVPVSSLAEVPHQISYQGYLTDSDGILADGDYDMLFTIYDAAGTSLWGESQTVTVTKGIYSVILGQNPFPSDLFDRDHISLGVTVLPDPEMTPRQKITATAFSMKAAKAEDSDTLDGKDSTQLDQSAHVFRTDNPHSVTATQTGAATLSDITWGNLSNIPAGFADDVDDTGITTETDPTILDPSIKDGVSWGELSGIPACFADGVDNTGITAETDPQVGTNVTNRVPKWDGSALVTGTMYDYLGRIGIGTSNPNALFEIAGSGTTYGHLKITDIGGNDPFMTFYADSSYKSSLGYIDGYARWYNNNGENFAIIGGNVGIGTATPDQKLEVDGIMRVSRQPAVIQLNNTAVGGGLWNLYAGNPSDGDFSINESNANNIARLFIKAGGKVGIGTTDPVQKLTVRGNILVQSESTGTSVLELGEGLDYAEGFDVSNRENIDSGAVLIIDPHSPGKLTLSTKPYDSKVAGIVAGAEGLGSGVRLGAGQFDYDVALAGRVYCNVDTTYSEVCPGDLLTTSSNPGYAMKVKDYARAQGAILGKAMQRLEKGRKGQILVLVTLQ